MIEQADLLAEAPPAAPVRMDTQHARLMLRKRFAAPEWALLEEVAPSTGGGTRYADGVAVNLWQSRGHAIYGFEVKVSRSDWLRELKQPEKTEQSVYRYCDRWFVVAPAGVVKDGELPPTWGLFELRASGLFAKVEAPKLEPKPVGRAFFASLMRRGHEQIEAIAASKLRLASMEAQRTNQKYIDEEVARRTKGVDRFAKQIAEFEEKTGLKFDAYNGPPVATVKLAQVLEGLQGWSGAEALGRLTNLAADLDRTSATLRKAIADTGLIQPQTEGAAT